VRLRIGSTIAVIAAAVGLAISVAGPTYSAFAVHSAVSNARIM
jgi:hypothetical protein